MSTFISELLSEMLDADKNEIRSDNDKAGKWSLNLIFRTGLTIKVTFGLRLRRQYPWQISGNHISPQKWQLKQK